MKEIYVVAALRTPFGSFSGMLADVEAPKLAAAVMRGLLAGTGLGAQAVDEVIVGQVLSGGCGQRSRRGYSPARSCRSSSRARGES